MKTIFAIMFFAIFLAIAVETPKSIAGVWRWNFKMPDGGELTPRLLIQQNGDTFTARAEYATGTEVPVQDFQFSSGKITFKVVRQKNGKTATTRYEGKIEGDLLKGTIVSDWNGADQTYDWEARRLAGVVGTWKWPSAFRGDTTAKFQSEGETLTGTMGGGGGRGGSRPVPLKNGSFKNNEVVFEVEREFAEQKFITRYEGLLTGDKIIGSSRTISSENPRTNNWEAVRVE